MFSHFFQTSSDCFWSQLPVMFLFLVPQPKKIVLFPRIRSSPPTRERANAVNLECWTRPQHYSERLVAVANFLVEFWGVFWCVFDVTKMGRNLVEFIFLGRGKKVIFRRCDFFGSFVFLSSQWQATAWKLPQLKPPFSENCPWGAVEPGQPKVQLHVQLQEQEPCWQEIPGRPPFWGPPTWFFFGPKTWLG